MCRKNCKSNPFKPAVACFIGLALHAFMILVCYWHSEYAPRYFSFFISLMVQWKVALRDKRKGKLNYFSLSLSVLKYGQFSPNLLSMAHLYDSRVTRGVTKSILTATTSPRMLQNERLWDGCDADLRLIWGGGEGVDGDCGLWVSNPCA